MTKSVAIIAASGANYASLQAACLRLGYSSIVTEEAERICQASHVILPGVGTAGYAMSVLRARRLDGLIPTLTQPVLGICLGMQLLCLHSEESDTACLKIIPLKVKALAGERIYPHMGWNQLQILFADNLLLQGVAFNDDLYFVHNYGVETRSPYTQSICQYGESFSATINYKNFYGVQFHPEKSGYVGELVLRNFFALARTYP